MRSAVAGDTKKFCIVPSQSDYYKYLAIQPGALFFKSLIHGKFPSASFSLNIPIILFQQTMLYTGMHTFRS